MKKTRMATGLLQSLKEANAIERGELKGRETARKLSRPAPKWSKTAIKKLREEMFEMSQPVFASLLNVKPATVRAWEQGQRTPDGAAARLLEILSKDAHIAEELAS
jgi:DNA-binding transcriptional regulator YiaG